MVQTDPIVTSFGFERPRTGAENMARDMELFSLVQSGGADVAMRLYTWDPWTVSLGKHQSADVVDGEAIEQEGFHVVHRPTGGRAVFHAEELTYCIVARHHQPQHVYELIHALILDALSNVVGPVFDAPAMSDRLREHYAAGTSLGQICFAASARTEITVNGRKVVGSAQRTMDGVVLQHGSILCGDAHLRLADLLVMEASERSAMRQVLQSSSATLSEVAGRSISPNECAEAIVKEFDHRGIRMFVHHEQG